jgi:predicted nucleic acid-binding protein
MSYWDTSTLVKLYVKESDSTAFEEYALKTTEPMQSSRIALYEARATFRRKEAEGVLHAGSAQMLYSQLLHDIAAGEIHILELGGDVEREYGQVLDLCYQQSPPIPVRTLDAIHLASARIGRETEIVATDKRMRDAAKVLGLSVFPF